MMTKDHKPYKKTPTVERFWNLVDKRAPDECWEWRGGLCGPGYGIFKVGTLGVDRRNVMAHRFAYELHYGPLEKLACLHRCDNKKCVNPSHLFSGTQADNMEDKVSKGRQPRGAMHYISKLDEQKLAAARVFIMNGWSYKKIADRFNVQTMSLWNALNGKSWKHVGGAPSEQ
jgi:hypothetical protein